MGIAGLLPLIKPHLTKAQFSSLKGKRIGIDGHGWLYKIAPIIAEEIYYGCYSTKMAKIFENKLNSALSTGVIPVFVFDGDSLSSKEKTNAARANKKNKAREEVRRLLDINRIDEARDKMNNCIHIPKAMIVGVLNLLKERNVEYIVSPYESDAQLSYLQRIEYIDYILTEDSDFMVYDCTNILYKYDLKTVCIFKREALQKLLGEQTKNFQDICILSGCDYLESLPGVGLKTAIKLFEKHLNIESIVDFMRRKKYVPENYLEEFKRAKITFSCQVVYDPIARKRFYLDGTNLPKSDLAYLGDLSLDNAVSHSNGEALILRDIEELCIHQKEAALRAQ